MSFSTILVLSTWMFSTFVAAAQQMPGFLSIDCGSTTQYKDSATNITWETDGQYTRTGMDGEVLHPPNSSIDNYQALRTFKYFPAWRNKFCYELPARTNISILIRAMFVHGNSSKLELPTIFDVYLNATLWSSIQYSAEDSSSDLYTPKILEGIFYSLGSLIYLCLVPHDGVPFISSLELRQFDPEGLMYSLYPEGGPKDMDPNSGRSKLFLSTICRYNVGTTGLGTVRYPDDAYDRLWSNVDLGYLVDAGWANQISSQEVYSNTNPAFNSVPPKVMMTAVTVTDSTWIPVVNETLSNFESRGYLYAAFYCEALNKSANYSGMQIMVNSEETNPFDVGDVPVSKIFDHFISASNVISVTLVSDNTRVPDSTAILNALEIYEEIIMDPSTTQDDTAQTLTTLKKSLNLTDWQGDSCFPTPDDWITCTVYARSNLADVDRLLLSNLNNTVGLRSISAELPGGLTELSVTFSDIDDITFQSLITGLAIRVIYNWNFTSNKISSISANSLQSMAPISVDSLDDLTTYSIDLSHNLLTGEFPKRNNTDATITIDPNRLIPVPVLYLNISYNFITSVNLSEYVDFATLDISYNSISSNILSISEMLRGNRGLKELHMSHNFFTGTFPSDIYFLRKSFPNLTLLNLDQNHITGVLNLSIWFQDIQEASTNLKLNRSQTHGLYSVVDNGIVSVVPDVDALESTIKFLMGNSSEFNQSGVLLGGNPYCKNAKSFSQRYLCRTSVNTVIVDDYKEGHPISLALILGIIFISICFIAFAFIIWRLWRKLSFAAKLLQDIEQELSNRKVQPPYFSYHDLKVATKNFSEGNKLGIGAFGAVYKGILPDGTTMAVKRLFNSEKETVLHEFLNEVVLITGIKHRNLIQLRGCCIQNKERILVYDFAENGNLADALWGEQDSQKLNWNDRVKVAIGVARGLLYLHEELQPRIIHRDIKAANVLLNESLAPKIADFGLARLFEDEETQAQFTAVAGTRGYWAPEYVMEGQLTTKADVYSFGILLLEIATGKKCIDGTESLDRIYLKSLVEDMRKEGSLLQLLPPDVRTDCPDQEFTKMMDIALLCTRTDPKLRPLMSQVMTMLSESMAVLTSWGTDVTHEEAIDPSFAAFLQDPDDLHRRSQSGFWNSEEIPLVSNPSLSSIDFNATMPFPEGLLSRLRYGFMGSEQIPLQRSRTFPSSSTTES